MSFSAELRAFLGLDTTGFKASLQQAGNDADNASGRLRKSFGGAAESQENLLASNHRVARQIQNFSKDLLSGASATDLFSAGLEGLERALRLPLGALAGLGIGAVAISQIAKVVSEYKELRQEVEKIAAPRPNGAFQTLTEIQQQAKAAGDEIEKLDKRQKGLFNKIKDAILGAVFDAGPAGVKNGKQTIFDPEKERADQIAKLQGVTGGAQTAEVDKLRAKNDLAGKPEFLAKAEAIEEKFLDIVQRLGQRGVVELDRELQNLAAEIARSRADLLKLSIDQLAGGPGFDQQNSASLQAISNAEQARQAQELEQQARDLVLNQGDLAGAAALRGRASEIRNGIGTLKDSEKDITGQFRGAIDSAGVFKEMLTALKQLNFTNR